MKNFPKLPVIIMIVVAMVASYYLLSRKTREVEKMSEQIEYENGVMVSPSQEIINPDTGEVDEEKFAQTQTVSEDDSLSRIETELNNTIILNEDLSSL